MDRECTSGCVAYSEDDELSEGAGNFGLIDMHCIRLFMELTDILNISEILNFEDFEDEDEF